MSTLEFKTLNGQIYSSIEEIVTNQKGGISLWLIGEGDCRCYNGNCNFFLTQEGIKIVDEDGIYTTFIRFDEIRTIRKF